MADASSSKIMTLFNKHWGGEKKKSEHYSAPKINDGTFTIAHYAGSVTYGANMGGSNRDTLTLDVTRLMIKSTGGKDALAASNAKTAKQAKQLLAAAAANAKKSTTVGDGGGIWGLAGAFEDKRPPQERSKRPPTAGYQFRQSMANLIAVLEACQPFYIRTIKPNDQKKAMTVDDARLVHQIQYLGLVESTRVKRAGFASRSTYAEFLGRYRMLSKATWPPKPEHQNNDEQGVRDLMAVLHMWAKPKTQGALGVGMGAGGNRLNAAAPKAKAGAGGAKAAAPAGAGAAKVGAAFLGGGGGAGAAGPKPDLLGLRRAGAGSRGAGGANAASAAAAAAPLEEWSGSQCPGDVNVAGSRMLVEGKDYQYGATKIFLKEPATLFCLEYMRVLSLGRVVSKVAALYRAHKGKRDYQKIKKAWLKQQANVRGHLQRKRYIKMKTSAVKCQAIIRGFLARISPTAMAMREGLGMISFYGKPRRRMSLHWSPPVKGDWLGLFMQQTQQGFGAASRSTSTGIPAPQAASLFCALSKLRPSQPPDSVQYADTVLKIKQNYTVLRRALVVTNDYILNFHDPWQKGRINRKILIQDVRGISMSPYRDGYLVIHCGDYDYVAMAETKVNLVRAIANRYKALTGADLPVTVAPEISYRAKKGDPPERLRRISIRQVPDLTFFEKRTLEPWEQKVLPSLASEGGTGGHAVLHLGDGGVTYAYAEASLDGGAGSGAGSGAGGGAESISIVQKSYMEAEKHRPKHEIGGDKASLLVSVPVPPKVKLASILTEEEKGKLRKMGVRAAL
jgi:Myosin head (motor domain)/Unconventional myosin tail, actin- and lipid-binding/IQ calmodulin-binding motif